MSVPAVPAQKPEGIGSAVMVLIAGAVVIGIAVGVRQAFGLFVGPFAFERGVPVTVFALAIALHTLVWGVAQPFAGAAVDRFGCAMVVAGGSILYAAGLVVTAVFPSGLAALIGTGILVGIGLSCTTYGVALAAIGRAVRPEQRSVALGIATAGGSLGQVAVVPGAQFTIDSSGVEMALFMLAGVVLLMVPFGFILDRNRRSGAPADPALRQPGLLEVLRLAVTNRAYVLLTLGFFTCGFQLSFISTHLPNYLVLCQMPAALGATALAVIGLFNVIGSWGCGWLGARYKPQHVLAWLYLLRGAAIAVFIMLPPTETVVLAFAVVLGLTWLGTTPLTSGVIARIFGVQHLGALFGVAFLSHQVGSFFGTWLGGYMFDLTGSYTLIWILTAAAGLFAALVNFPIRDPVGMQPARA